MSRKWELGSQTLTLSLPKNLPFSLIKPLGTAFNLESFQKGALLENNNLFFAMLNFLSNKEA